MSQYAMVPLSDLYNIRVRNVRTVGGTNDCTVVNEDMSSKLLN
jgi:hypothetical protein